MVARRTGFGKKWSEMTSNNVRGSSHLIPAEGLRFIPMTGAEFRVAREFLGMSREALAEHLNVKVTLIRQWDQGASRVPIGVEREIQELRDKADACVAKLIAEVRAGRTRIEVPMGPQGAFHRAIAARVLRVVDAEVEYPAA